MTYGTPVSNNVENGFTEAVITRYDEENNEESPFSPFSPNPYSPFGESPKESTPINLIAPTEVCNDCYGGTTPNPNADPLMKIVENLNK